jgi:hypothetical protein
VFSVLSLLGLFFEEGYSGGTCLLGPESFLEPGCSLGPGSFLDVAILFYQHGHCNNNKIDDEGFNHPVVVIDRRLNALVV